MAMTKFLNKTEKKIICLREIKKQVLRIKINLVIIDASFKI